MGIEQYTTTLKRCRHKYLPQDNKLLMESLIWELLLRTPSAERRVLTLCLWRINWPKAIISLSFSSCRHFRVDNSSTCCHPLHTKKYETKRNKFHLINLWHNFSNSYWSTASQQLICLTWTSPGPIVHLWPTQSWWVKPPQNPKNSTSVSLQLNPIIIK